MSLFRIHEWLGFDLSSTLTTFSIGQFIESRDQLIVGNEEGTIQLYDPGRIIDLRQQACCLLDQSLSTPIIQISAGKFIAGFDENCIATLHPRKLCIFRLIADGHLFKLSQIHEHNFDFIAYNMCTGSFTHSKTIQICIQGLDCSLHVFEGEQMSFRINTSLWIHPGPMVYAPQSDSIILTSGGYVSSIRFTTLAAASSFTHGKKLTADWTLNLGDWPNDISVIDVAPVQPSIVVLCKRILLCLTHGGTLRFSIRFQTSTTALLVYNATNDAYIQLCIATSTRTLLFYADNVLIWSAQCDADPIQLGRCTFNSTYRGMMAVLSKGHLSVGYLGTEPSLFSLPASQTRFINFEERQKELFQYEASIKKSNSETTSDIESKPLIRLEWTSKGIDEKSLASDVQEEVPSLSGNLQIFSENVVNDVRLVCNTKLYTENKYICIQEIDKSANIPFVFFAKNDAIYDLRCNFFCTTSSSSNQVASIEIEFPLNLMCRTAASQRNAKHKFTIESSEPTLEISTLFPERYRILSDSFDWFHLFVRQLINRIKTKQKDVNLNFSLPIDSIMDKLNEFSEMQKKCATKNDDLEKLCTQLRGSQAAILTKLKAQRPTSISHLETFWQYSYSKLLEFMDENDELEMKKLAAAKSLSSALDLLNFLTRVSDNEILIDGSILNGNLEEVPERIKWTLSTFGQTDKTTEIPSSALKNFIRAQSERGSNRMENIDEESDDHEDEGNQINPIVSGSLPLNRSTE